MAPTLDLSQTSSHAKMIVSPPRLNLRRAASYTHEKGPLSSTSSRFNFNHLIFASPPPSPGLPQLLPRPRKPSGAPRPSRVLRVLIWVLGTAALVYFVISRLRRAEALVIPAYAWSRRPYDDYEMVGQEELPDFPTPIVVSDRRGKAKWTVSIPPNYDFPLTTKEYTDMCSKCREVAQRVDALQGRDQPARLRRERTDRHFVDVHEAELAGFLPGAVSIGTLLSQQGRDGDLIGENKNSLVDRPVCATSMTFVLASGDAGLGRTLMLLWMAYAVAQAEGRAFFIDDTRWAYGRYTGIFGAPPVPSCRPALRHEMLPCPRQARHLVVTLETAKEIFVDSGVDGGDGGGESGEGSRGVLFDDRAMFDLARQGYEALFRLNAQDADYVTRRVAELRSKTKVDDSHSKQRQQQQHPPEGMVIGVHVRRGDRHPMEFQYRDSYVPVNVYSERAREIVNATYWARGRVASEVAKGHSLVVLASDDPTVYESEEFVGAARAQELIRLASKAAIQQAGGQDRNVMHKFVDETFGWEGGFFAAMFWNLGLSTLSAAPVNHRGAAAGGSSPSTPWARPSSETVRLRSLVGRAYMMDLAVLAGAGDAVVCTVSATGCRLLAVMMGWEAAFERGGWVNIDGEYGWWAVEW